MYTFAGQSAHDFDQTIEEVTDELEKRGFGVLTEINVQKTLKKKLDEDFRRYRILGACNPNFAHQIIEEQLSVGTLLPCNVIVYQDSDNTFVEAVDPRELAEITENEEIDEVAEEIAERLKETVEELKAS